MRRVPPSPATPRTWGLHIPVANVSFVGSENLLALMREGRSDPESHTRWLVNSQVVPSYEDTSLAAVREYRELMERYNPPPPEDVDRIAEGEPYEPFPQSFVSLEGFRQREADHGDHQTNGRRSAEVPDRGGRLPGAQLRPRGRRTGALRDPTAGRGLQRVYYTVPNGDRFVPLDDWEARFGLT